MSETLDRRDNLVALGRELVEAHAAERQAAELLASAKETYHVSDLRVREVESMLVRAARGGAFCLIIGDCVVSAEQGGDVRLSHVTASDQ